MLAEGCVRWLIIITTPEGRYGAEDGKAGCQDREPGEAQGMRRSWQEIKSAKRGYRNGNIDGYGAVARYYAAVDKSPASGLKRRGYCKEPMEDSGRVCAKVTRIPISTSLIN